MSIKKSPVYNVIAVPVEKVQAKRLQSECGGSSGDEAS